MKRILLLAGIMAVMGPLVFAQAIGIFEGQASIGTDNGQGIATYSSANGTYDVVASGDDIWGSADGCYFVYKKVTGPFVLTGEVNWEKSGPRDGDEWKKAGFMARDGDNPADDASSPHVTGIIIRSQGSNLEHRLDYGGSSDDVEVQEKRADETNVIQLMRVGNTFTMLRGLQDGSFHTIGSTEHPDMPAAVWAGLTVTSHDTNTTERAYFKNVTLKSLSAGVTLTRTIPVYKTGAGSTVAGISLGLTVETGKTTDVTITEKVPAGFIVSNVKPSIGKAVASADGVITWTITGATGSDAKLTYDSTVPKNTAGVTIFKGSAMVGTELYSCGGNYELTVIPPLTNGFGPFTKSEDVFIDETVPGDAGYDPAAKMFTVTGTGSDIGGSADNFRFVYVEVNGKVSLKANVQLYVGAGHTEWAKAGLMIRDSLEVDSAYGLAMIRSWGRDFGPQWRDYAGNSTASNDSINVPGGTEAGRQNGTIEITRNGTNVGFYYYDASTGKQTETLIQEIPDLTDPIYAGLAVTSRSTGQSSTGIFTNVVLTVNDKPVPVQDWCIYE